MNETILTSIIFILFIWCSSLSGEIYTLKKHLKEENIIKDNSDKVKGLLTKNIGKQVILKFDDDYEDMDLEGTACEILDVDERWVLVRYANRKRISEKLIRLSVVKGLKYSG